MTFVTRFAPSPTGYLHLGHGFSALTAYDLVKAHAGHFILRIEDIDQNRAKPKFIQAIYDDLHWLGIEWEYPVRRQSRHLDDYQQALDQLKARHLVYPCFCTRTEIKAEIARSASAPHGISGIVYPGTCRSMDAEQAQARIAAGDAHAWRLNMKKAAQGRILGWEEQGKGWIKAQPEAMGDIVLGRKDAPASYHLAVVHDDAVQGITHIARGNDLFHATHVHVVLQSLFGWPTPVYRHHPLITDEKGARLAKRRGVKSLQDFRTAGMKPDELRMRIGLWTGQNRDWA